MTIEEVAELVKSWLYEAGKLIQLRMQEKLEVSTKTTRSDVVTNVDREVQEFLVQKILTKFPNDQILAEENGRNTWHNFKARTWVIDPIDGTLNFVFQHENFAVMIGIIEPNQSDQNNSPNPQEGNSPVGQLGFIYDVVRDALYWGGSGLGVYCNDQKLTAPANNSAYDGLWGMNGQMFAHNEYNLRDFAEKTMGVRVVGSAAMEFISVLRGQTVGYISYNYPWDYTAGMIMARELGLEFSNLQQQPLDFSTSAPVVVATSQAYQELFQFFRENNP